MSSNNQLQNVSPAQGSPAPAQQGETDKVYRIAVLLIVALVYMVYVSPRMRARSVAAKTAGAKAMYRWVDLLTKLVLVYLIALSATCNQMVSLVITLVFLLFATQDYDTVVIEPKHKMVEKMTGDEDDLDEGDDIDSDSAVDEEPEPVSDFEFERRNGEFVFESDTPILFPLNSGSIDNDMADEVGDVYEKPFAPRGLTVDTVAESEQLANAQGLGLNIMRSDEAINAVSGMDPDAVNSAPVENFDGGCGCNRGEEAMDANEVDEAEEEEVEVPRDVEDAIDETVEQVAEEANAEKEATGEKVVVSEQSKNEVRKVARFVVFRMNKDGKPVTGHDILMICRSVMGQMYKCKFMMRSVMDDAKSRAENQN